MLWELFSGKFTLTQQKYSIYVRELNAVYQTILHFRYALEGFFTFKQSNKKASPRRTKLMLPGPTMQCYIYTVNKKNSTICT